MARIPDSEIERLKSEVSVVRLIENLRAPAHPAEQGLCRLLSGSMPTTPPR